MDTAQGTGHLLWEGCWGRQRDGGGNSGDSPGACTLGQSLSGFKQTEGMKSAGPSLRKGLKIPMRMRLKIHTCCFVIL